jgi:RNA polymerase sigma-32 factor
MFENEISDISQHKNLYHDINKNDLLSYVHSIKHFPMLSVEEEFDLARKWQDEKNEKAAHKLLQSHMRLVTKIASGYRGYGLPLQDLVSERHLGMMQAIRKFDPGRGFRFSTYASYWIHAAMKDYVIKTWSLVKMGTGAEHKKLFFGLRKMKRKHSQSDVHLSDESIDKIAAEMNVDRATVIHMDQRLSGQDYSLNAARAGEDTREWQDWLADEAETHDVQIAHHQEQKKRQALLDEAMEVLNARELEVLNHRRLKEPPETLEEISERMNISRERVRQIEVAAFHKLQHEVQKKAKKMNMC